MVDPIPERRVHERRLRAERPAAAERRRGDRRMERLTRSLAVAPSAVRGARRILVSVAVTVALVDLVDKAASSTLPGAYHARSAGAAAAMVAVTILGAWAFPRAGSVLVAVAGGLMVGGAIANTLSLGIWADGVPNPLVSFRYDVAFNIADVCVVAGFFLLFPALLLFAVQHHDELRARL